MCLKVNRTLYFTVFFLLSGISISGQINKREIRKKLKELNEYILSIPGGPNLTSKAMVKEYFVSEDVLISDFFSDSLGRVNNIENIFNHLTIFDTLKVKLELIEICRELTVNNKKVMPCVVKQTTESYINGALPITRNDTLLLVYNFTLSPKDSKEKKIDNAKIFSIDKSKGNCEEVSDEKFWEYCLEKERRKSFRDYLKFFPNGKFADIAKEKKRLNLNLFPMSGGRWMSQRHSCYVGLGGALYNGDLYSNFKTIRPAIRVSYNYRLFERVTIRSALSYIRLYGDDSYGSNTKARNLRFNCNLLEPSFIWEYYFIKNRLNPRYSFSSLHGLRNFSASLSFGVGFSYYSPYTFYNGEKYHLRNLSTEGQGLGVGVERYSDFLLSYPLGISFKYSYSRNILISFDLSYNITNTDYLDDVSGLYYDKENIREMYGDVAAELSDRRTIVDSEYRGNPNKKNDGYLSFLIGFDFILRRDKRGLPKF